MAAHISYPVRKLINLSEDMIAGVAEYRFSRRIASENKAIRQLIELGLKAAAKSFSK